MKYFWGKLRCIKNLFYLQSGMDYHNEFPSCSILKALASTANQHLMVKLNP